MIHPDSVAGTYMDNIKSLGASLCAHHKVHGDGELVMFKSDIHEAYCLMWISMCPEWQAKQVVTSGAKHYVDFCNCFRN
jgi:elongation factor P--beta-lysine ligase